MKSFAILVSILVASGSLDGQQPAPGSTVPGRNIPAAGTDTSGFGAGGLGGGPAAVRSGEAAPVDLYGAGLLREEGEGDLASAEAAYRLAIQQFDRQREGAANAIFRLGEVYRKMGRTEEAKVQYARILREFPDMVRLTQLSHAQLIGEEGGTRSTSRGGSETTFVAPGPGTSASPGTEDALNRTHRVMTERIERFGPLPGGGFTTAPPLRPRQDGRIACVENLKQLGLAARIYASEHQAAYPSTVLAMQQEIGASPDALICPSDNERQRAASWVEFDPAVHMTYEYHGESVGETDAGKLLFRCPIHDHVARADGSVMLGPDASRPDAAAVESVLLQRYGLGARTAEPARAVGIINHIINNLRQIDGAKQQWALENRQPQGVQPTQEEVAVYVAGGFPTSLAGERYEMNPVGMPPVAVLTQPLGNRKPGERITIGPPDQVVEMRQREPIRIQVREDGSLEVDGEAIPVEVDALRNRLRKIGAGFRSAVLVAEDRSPPESLMTVVEAAYAAKLSSVEVDSQARKLIQREAARWTEEIARLERETASLWQEHMSMMRNRNMLAGEVKAAEELVGPARQRFDASHTYHVRLPGMISQDERYQKLKAQYEAAVLDGDEEAEKRARARLQQWVYQIYRPELAAELEFAMENVHRSRSNQEELEARNQRVVSERDQLVNQVETLRQRQVELKTVVPDLEAAP